MADGEVYVDICLFVEYDEQLWPDNHIMFEKQTFIKK